MRFEIVKCHGSGNDFPLIDARGHVLDDAGWVQVARALAERAGPVGGDGLLLLTAGDGITRFGMRMYNPDGSEAETCLNGLRCVARAGFSALGIAEADVALTTSQARVVVDPDVAPGVYTVRETAGPASHDIAAWPMHIGRVQNIDRPIEFLPSDRAFTAVAMPNPHLVSFVERIDEAELIAVGQACEAAPPWLPRRANVSFVVVRGADLFVRTFERGVGLTDSCGSAMAASTHAAALTGRIAWGADAVVYNRGGLVRGIAERDGMVTLSGNATWVWRGTVAVDLATGRASDLTIETRFDDEGVAWAAVRDRAAAWLAAGTAGAGAGAA